MSWSASTDRRHRERLFCSNFEASLGHCRNPAVGKWCLPPWDEALVARKQLQHETGGNASLKTCPPLAHSDNPENLPKVYIVFSSRVVLFLSCHESNPKACLCGIYICLVSARLNLVIWENGEGIVESVGKGGGCQQKQH